ncbi:MAG: glycosyltransferase [Chitinophagaceae bacterium]|nr:glycosyltransferase [Chitinophagaceae bacterium]
MKVIFTIDSLAQGGTEQSIADLIANFKKELEIVVVYFYDAHQLLETYESLNCKIFYLGIGDKYGFYKSVSLFYKLVIREKPDLVVSSLYRSLIISRLVCWVAKIPLVGTFVNESYSSDRKERFKGTDIVKFYMTWFLDRITAFIPVKVISNSYSISVLNGQALGIDSNRIKVIYRGRDIRDYKAWYQPESNGKFIWISIGRLIPQKGYDILLQAFYEIKKKHSNIQLRIIGEGPLRNELEMLIKDLHLEDEVILEGNKPLGWKNLYDANAFVLSSVSEGFSGALVEALITGIPIVASDIPMNIEAISPGKDAYLFKSKDQQHLYEKMLALMNEYAHACELGKFMRSRAIENYDIQHVADNYQKTLETVVYGTKS